MMRNLIAFPYYGGKNSHLSWMLPLLPGAESGITHYCEPFGGSAAVLLNREPVSVETYNDIDEALVNFFRVLRHYPDELFRLLNLTPFARREFENCRNTTQGLSDIERARRFYVHVRQSWGAKLDRNASWGASTAATSRGMSRSTSAWWGGLDNLVSVAARLLRVQIECMSAVDVIHKYDTPHTLFYCDPPYILGASADQAYKHDYSEQDHIWLAQTLHRIDGLAAVSGYRCTLLDALYSDWIRYDAKAKMRPCAPGSKAVVESLWMNYEDV